MRKAALYASPGLFSGSEKKRRATCEGRFSFEYVDIVGNVVRLEPRPLVLNVPSSRRVT